MTALRGGYAAGETFAAILIGGGVAGGEAAAAIGLAGGGIAQRLDWPALAAGIDTAIVAPLIVAEAAGIADDDLDAGLTVLADFAVATATPVVIAFSVDQIDLVSARLFGETIHALCEPAMAERVAEVVVAAAGAGLAILHDPMRESNNARLDRLHEEIGRIAEALKRLTRAEEGSASDVYDRRRSFDAGPGATVMPSAPIDPGAVRRAIRQRRLRDVFFAGNLFEDPAWDMLLDLFAAELEGRRVSVSSLCIAAAVAPTTALRWITRLTEVGLFQRQDDPRDGRRAFIGLSAQGSAAMRGYWARAAQA